jgi:hypothetical protein
MLWQARPGFIAGRGAIDGSAGAGAGYTYVGSYSDTNVNSATPTIAQTMPGVAGLLVVFFGSGTSRTITSVVYDPTGANVTLTQDAFQNSSGISSVYSGVIGADSGSKNIVVTVSSAFSFSVCSGHFWVATNLSSNVKQQSVTNAFSGATATISVVTGDIILGAAALGASNTGVDYATSSQVPNNIRSNAVPDTFGADWTGVSTNASFNITPKAATAYRQAWATYR